MKKYILILLPLVLICCNSDDLEELEQEKENCLAEIEQSTFSCELSNTSSDCEIINVGSKRLSGNIKSNFIDFCNELNSEIIFQDSNGNINIGTIDEKLYRTSSYRVTAGINSPNCKSYCLDNEEAYVILRSDRFSIRITLVTGLDFTVNSEDISKRITTDFSIWGMYQNSRQLIFNLPVEDYKDEPIEPDTTYLRYHDNKILNNENYTDIYSNENNDGNGLVRKEKVYFHPKDGLIGVRDSLGVLWTIK